MDLLVLARVSSCWMMPQPVLVGFRECFRLSVAPALFQFHSLYNIPWRLIDLYLGLLGVTVAPLKRFLAVDFVRRGFGFRHLFLGNNSFFRRGYLGRLPPQLPHAKKGIISEKLVAKNETASDAFLTPPSSKMGLSLVSRAHGRYSAIRLCARHVRSADTSRRETEHRRLRFEQRPRRSQAMRE